MHAQSFVVALGIGALATLAACASHGDEPVENDESALSPPSGGGGNCGGGGGGEGAACACNSDCDVTQGLACCMPGPIRQCGGAKIGQCTHTCLLR
jgi:hypothetical protein